MDRMYILFHNRTGEFAHMSAEGVAQTISVTGLIRGEIIELIQKLHIGEYCHLGPYTVVSSAGGFTPAELKAR